MRQQSLRVDRFHLEATADPPQLTLTTPYDAAVQGAINFYYDQQLTTLGAIAAAPRRLWPVFIEAGGSLALFNSQDTKILACCLRELDAEDARAVARRWLVEEQLWDAAAPECWYGRMIWSDATVALLFGSWYESPLTVAHEARKLRSLAEQLKEIRDAERYLGHVIAKIGCQCADELEVAA